MVYSGKIKKMLSKTSPGDELIVKTCDEELKGVLVERPDYLEGNNLIIKLKNGYNLGISPEEVLSVKLLKKYKPLKEKKTKSTPVKNKPTISILHTGGTIASKVDYRTGGVVSRFTPEEMLKTFPKLKNYANVRSVFMGNMFSDDMRFHHYKKMTQYILEEIKKGTRGVIITHGTDTMAYTSAALSFIFENLQVPVILVGAQRSSDRGSSDAESNLMCAVNFILNTDFAGVGVCMHENSSDETCLIHKGTKVRKMHSSRRDAFKTVNDEPIARVNYYNNSIEFLSKNYTKKSSLPVTLRARPAMEDKVALLKIHTNMMPEQISFYREKKYKGLVIEGTGLGHMPINEPDNITKKYHRKIRLELKKLIQSGCAVVMTSQTINGMVNMNVYSPGRVMQKMGVIPGDDMLSETAFIKLAWLLKNAPRKQIAVLMRTNMRGEISGSGEK